MTRPVPTDTGMRYHVADVVPTVHLANFNDPTRTLCGDSADEPNGGDPDHTTILGLPNPHEFPDARTACVHCCIALDALEARAPWRSLLNARTIEEPGSSSVVTDGPFDV